MSAQEELEKVRNQKKALILTLAKIRDMVNKGVVVNGIGNNTIEFVDGEKKEPYPFKSGYYTKISPSEIRKAKSFFKKEYQQWLEDKAGEYDLLETKEKMCEKMAKLAEDF